MDAFDRLSPALQYQITGGLGWTSLRPVQEQAIDAVLDGDNCVVLAPTAGGKTEAAILPLLSMMDTADLPATSVLYVAPLRALLNNQEARLQALSGLVGRRAFKWHGDVGTSARKRFVSEPTDILAITPESLEAMLMSTWVPASVLLENVQAVIVDEVHAFAAGDRGAHLVSVLERIRRIAGRDIQRIGLSATVGDPETICDWLAGSSTRRRRVVDPGGRWHSSSGGERLEPRLALDYVGDLANAAKMIDRLAPGTRRLVFVDSRRRVEELGDLLAQRGVDVLVTHSSLAPAERAAAERAFEERPSCVVVATSALELGLDIGELERVFQIDCPATVSSFLQRMGRTGRRPGTRPNCTFLTTSPDATLQAAAMLRLDVRRYVEPAAPSRRASHVLAHQLLALGIQQQGVGLGDWWRWLEGSSAFDQLEDDERRALVEHMLKEDILISADARLSLGRRGERLYAGRNFMELYAVFSVPPVLKVQHGRRPVGTIDAWFAQQDQQRPLTFVLSGRAWEAIRIDWRRGVCQVKPAQIGTYPRWQGRPVLLSRPLCQSMRDLLLDSTRDAWWSERAATVIDELRESQAFLPATGTAVVSEASKAWWWTFAGGKANTLLALRLQGILGDKVTSNNLCVIFSDEAAKSDLAILEAIRELAAPGALTWEHARRHATSAARGRVSKFQPCLPEGLERDLIARTLLDLEGALATLAEEPPLLGLVREMRHSLDREPEVPAPTALPLDSHAARTRTTVVQPRHRAHWIDAPESLRRACRELANEPFIGLDVETTLRSHTLCLVQVASPTSTFLIDALALEDLEPLAHLLRSPSVTKVIHNASFERRVLGAAGIEIEPVFDTLTASRAVRGTTILGGHGLASVCERELGLLLDKSEQTSDWRKRPLSGRQLDYAALDVEVLVQLMAVFQEDSPAQLLLPEADAPSRFGTR